MKNMYLILTTFFLFTGCSEEKSKQQENSIYGTWKLIERFDGGSPIPIQTVENGEILILGNNGSYSNSSYSDNGTFILNNSIIEISIPNVTQDLIKFTYGLENNELTLSSYPSNCDEGCYDKYIKLTSEE
jgi:hypothetical protein